jgi:hypothetical protein
MSTARAESAAARAVHNNNMKFQILGLADAAACFVLRFDDVAVMLDCAVEESSLSRFTPRWSSTAAASSTLVQIGERVFTDGRPKFDIPAFDLVLCQGERWHFERRADR